MKRKHISPKPPFCATETAKFRLPAPRFVEDDDGKGKRILMEYSDLIEIK
ncbi:hypothetical protein [Conchiformibius kuhniae]|uniref:Uncharacterized protein n=1 Tax=Conchiformibius kuhniae TaxID=211502 RepID=A0A8T9MTB6_9NEIS|nr:hypothetical protein [Conchiformibius kuhniae]UOP04519.1 hypothetical protein LVJ77_09590 [Conchiformibius kuhniae]